MKKKLSIVILVVLSVVLAFAACRFPAPRGLEWDRSEYNWAEFVVHGNGTAAVQQGRYVYFVNGFRPSSYDDGRSNSWGNVETRGGIFRAQLAGSVATANDEIAWTDSQGIRRLQPGSPIAGSDWVMDTYDNDELEYLTYFVSNRESVPVMQADGTFEYEYVDKVAVDLIVPMVGAVSSRDAGLWIFGEWIYYTSPYTGQDRDRNVRHQFTTFWRTRLDGTDTQRIHTTTRMGHVPFTFMFVHGTREDRRDDRVYLVIQEGNDINHFGVYANRRGSVRGGSLAENIEEAILPTISAFDINDRTTVRAEDFVYFTREVRPDQDGVWGGNIVERLRANGMAREIITEASDGVAGSWNNNRWIRGSERLFASNQMITIVAVRNGVLFFRLPNGQLHYDNFGLGGINIRSSSQAPVVSNMAPYTGFVHPFREVDNSSNRAFAIVTSADSLLLRSNVYTRTLHVGGGNVNVEFFDGREYVYFTTADDTRLQRVSINIDSQAQVLTESEILTTYLRVTQTAGHLVFFRDLDTRGRNYTFFMRATSNPDEREFFVGRRDPNEIPDEDEDDNGYEDEYYNG